MSEFEIRLTAEAEQNREETMRTLCEAAEEIGKSQEQDFQTLKERKWYQRLLKTVTFSNAAEQKKLLIKDVSSLSKLYEITLRALYLLWQDTDILTAQAEQQSEILEKLSAQQQVLFENQSVIVGQLLRLKYRHSQRNSLTALNESAKRLIVSALYTISLQIQEQPEVAKEYIRSILTYAKINAPDADVTPEDVEALKKAEAELLYQMLAEYQLFLGEQNVMDTELVDALPVSIKRRREIQTQAAQLADRLGTEFFLSYYQNQADDSIAQMRDDDLKLESADAEEEAENAPEESETAAQAEEPPEDVIKPAELELVTLPDTWHIGAGQTVRFENKIIHITSPIIRCEGSLEFMNCEIHYGENPEADCISLSENSSVRMKYCTVICDGKTEKWLLTVDKVQETISVEHCYFYNCTRFLFSRSSCTFRYCSFSGCSEFLWTRLANGYPIEFSNCNIVTPGEEFINDSGSVKLSACEILLIYRAKTSSKSGTRFIRGSNIDIFPCKVQGNLRFSSAEEAAGLKELYGLPHFTWGNTKITESSFYGVYGIAERDADAERCIFDNCMSLSLSTAQNCRFDRCMEVIDGNSVSNCQFNQCYGARLISTHLGGKIDLCEFNGWEAERAKLNVASYSYRLEQEMRDIFLSAMITLELSNSSKNDKRCIISACTFNGMRTHFDKVIAPFFCNKATERKVELNKCRFINCATERKDQKMIQTSGHYSDFVKKEHWITVIVVDDCKGLNQVWTDSTPNSYTVMTETVDGQTLGCNEELFETFSSGVLHMDNTAG